MLRFVPYEHRKEQKMSTRASTRRKRTLIDLEDDIIVGDVVPAQNAQPVRVVAAPQAASAGPDPKRARRSRSPSIVFVGIRRVAPAPFNDEAADLLIKSAADTEFMVYRSILAAASPALASRITAAAERAAAEAELHSGSFTVPRLIRITSAQVPRRVPR
ncbi:hypothetical protein GY45DRAFT_1373021 [Cubamyces sp. BRFM 1775]|nr:hypothetical protein GY45DRAFT_1373021 [Cubamyces sp. BRFM 1775]